MLGLSADQLSDIDQELKEAICDALVNLTISRISGDGADGKILYSKSPRRSIVSGQLLPRFDEAGQNDETNDIRIAAIGIDFQVLSESQAEAIIEPRFSVYVRVLPDWDEISGDEPRLAIEFKLRSDIQDSIDHQIRHLREERFAAANIAKPDWPNLNPNQRQKVRERRSHILSEVRREVYGSHGITLNDDDTSISDLEGSSSGSNKFDDHEKDSGEPQDNDGITEERLAIGRLLQEGRNIPIELLQNAPIPPKWRRIEMQLPRFSWMLNATSSETELQINSYNNELRNAISQQLKDWFTTDEGKSVAWRDVRILPQNVASEEAWSSFRASILEMPVPVSALLPQLDGLGIHVDRIVDYTDTTKASIRVTLDNRSHRLSGRDATTRTDTVFQAALGIRFPRSEHQPLQLDRVKPSYRYRHFLSYPAIGLNCGVESAVDGADQILRTTWAPKFVQPRIVPRQIDVPVSFERLANDRLNVSEFKSLTKEYLAWIKEEQNRLKDSVREGLSPEDADRESARLTKDIAAQLAECSYIERGINLLQESQEAFQELAKETNEKRKRVLHRKSMPYRAWILTNQSYFERDGAKPDRGWRLFQLAFILAHVPSLASRMEEYRSYQDEDIDSTSASLLYFPTGGGKSEAFYGTLLFSMFLDRLRGKDRGITAMIRYPLRLLTLQQGQRLLKLVSFAELVRRREGVGSWPFEIGFWVGSANTPNRYKPVPSMVPLIDDASHSDDRNLKDDALNLTADQQEQAQKYDEYRAAFNKIPNCPLCAGDTGLRRVENEGPTAKRLAIVCFNEYCDWNQSSSTRTPLPFLLTDDTIYQRAPSIVLGTIDKMAMLGQHTSTIRQFMGMFGLARGIGPTGHLDTPRAEGDILSNITESGRKPVFPAFRSGQRVFYDPFPSLIIQDEAHLLEESLGTFSGLFDSALERVFCSIDEMAGEELSVAKYWNGDSWAGPRFPKIIAATATISNPDRQLEVLYQRRPLRFPSPGSDIYNSFFSSPAPIPNNSRDRVKLAGQLPQHERAEATSPWMRQFVSLMTNDATHTVTSVATLSAFHAIITSMWRGLQDVNFRTESIELLKNSQTSDSAAAWRIAAIDRAIKEGRETEILALVDLHRVALAYVTNKKGGDQVMDALDSAVQDRHKSAGEPPMPFISRLISGGVDMKEIQEIMELAESDNAGCDYPKISERLRNIVATSAISHGVDVDRFNSMFFAGLPSDIAEYIQASSRVGRSHVGFVMLIPTPQSRRDRYVVETHDIFHRFLERMIAPPAVERWAENAIRRVLASFVQTWALLKENSEFVASTDDQKKIARSYEFVNNISALAKQDQVSFMNDVGDFILQAIGFQGRGTSRIGKPVYAEHYRRLIDSEVERLAQNMRSIETLMLFSDYWKDFSVFKAPMTSLRDVDEAGIITAAAFDSEVVRGRHFIDRDELIQVMRAIRNQRGVFAETDSDSGGGSA